MKRSWDSAKHLSAGNYMFKLNKKKNTRTRHDICSNVFIVNFEQANADWAMIEFFCKNG